MTLSIAIMAHPKRAQFVDELLPQLPGAEVVLDRHGDRWDTGRRALLAYDPGARFHCVVQDDALLCKDFADGAELVAAAASERPVGLYVGKVRPHAHTVTPAVLKAQRAGRPWISGIGPLWGVAIVLPTAHIAELVEWCDTRGHIANYDRRIETFYREQGIDCWYPIPSLADHRPVDENPSLIQGRRDNRQAHVFLGDRSPLDIDWSAPPIPIHGLTAEVAASPTPDTSTQRSDMALRRYTLVHEDGSEVVKLIDEAHVAMFRRAVGVVSIEPADDESFEPTPVRYEGESDDDDPENESDDDLDDDSDEDDSDDESKDLDDGSEDEPASESDDDDPENESEAQDDYSELNQPALKAALDEREIEYPGGPVSNDALRTLLRDDDAQRAEAAERDDDGEAIA